jgi:phage FluMu gp28-like protein
VTDAAGIERLYPLPDYDPDALLLPYQVHWNRDTAPLMAWEKSRRIGASYGEAADDVLHAMAERGGNVAYISYAQHMTSGYISDAAKWAKAFHLAASEIGESVFTRDDDRDIHVYEITFASGKWVRAYSNNPRNLRSIGRPGDRVVIDEAAFVDDLDELLKAAMAIIMWGGQVRVLSTHNGEESPFNQLVQDIRARKFGPKARVHRTPLDDALAQGLCRRIAKVKGDIWTPDYEAEWLAGVEQIYRANKDEELYCIPSAGGGAYLPRSLVEACMPRPEESGPLLRYEGDARFNHLDEPARRREMADWLREAVAPVLAGLDPNRRHVVGRDFARSGDMSDLVIVELTADVRRVWRAVVEMHNVPFAQQQQAVFFCIDHLPRFAGAAFDARGNGQAEAEAARDKYGAGRVQLVMLSESTYREQMPLYKAQLEDRTTVLVRNDDVLEDHRAVRNVRGVPKVPDGKTDAKGQRHGDSAVAGMLANMAADAPAGPLEWEPVARGAEIARGLGELRDELDPWADPRGLL